MPHERLGEGVCAYIIPMPDSAVDIGQIIALAGEAGLAKQKLPQHIELVDDLPRTVSGKVKKDILRKRIKAQMSAS